MKRTFTTKRRASSTALQRPERSWWGRERGFVSMEDSFSRARYARLLFRILRRTFRAVSALQVGPLNPPRGEKRRKNRPEEKRQRNQDGGAGGPACEAEKGKGAGAEAGSPLEGEECACPE